MSSPATPPVWKVRMVSCVPGWPIDWAATMPTASPELHRAAGGQAQAVAGAADAVALLAGEHGAHPDRGDGRLGGDGFELAPADDGPGLQLAATGHLDHLALHLDRVGQHPAEERLRRLRMGGSPALARTVRVMPRSVPQSGDAHDDLLGHVHQAPGQVPGVGGAQGGVGQALAGPVGGDEVLQHREALAEVGPDGPRDDVAPRVGHQAAHAGDLAHLGDVAAGPGAHHHVDGVEALSLLRTFSIDSLTSPVASVQISISSWRRSSSVMTPRR